MFTIDGMACLHFSAIGSCPTCARPESVMPETTLDGVPGLKEEGRVVGSRREEE